MAIGLARFARFGEAAAILGAGTGANLRQWFRRGVLPLEALIDAGERRKLVDIELATQHLRARRRGGRPERTSEGAPA